MSSYFSQSDKSLGFLVDNSKLTCQRNAYPTAPFPTTTYDKSTHLAGTPHFYVDDRKSQMNGGDCPATVCTKLH